MNATTPIDSFRVRNFQQPDDISRLLTLLMDAESIDMSGEDISETTVHAQLEVPEHDLQRDHWVIEHPHEPHVLIGQAAIYIAAKDTGSLTAEVNLVVHPRWRRRGLGSALFSSVLNRARDLGANTIRLYADPQHVPSVQFLTKKCFSPVAAYSEMRSTLLHHDPSLPDGFTILPYTAVNDPSFLTTAYNTCYAEQWGHHPVSLERVEQWLQHFNLDGLFFMFAPDHTLVGMCRSEPSLQRTERNGQPTGYIDAPGMIPAFRAQPLYRALLSHAAHWLSPDNSILELESWGDAPETIKLYQDLGFGVLRQQHIYQLALEPL